MKKRTAILRLTNVLLKVVATGLTAVHAYCQSTFQNLGFEDGTLVPIPGDSRDRLEFAPAMPGWTGYLGTIQINWIEYNEFFFNGSLIAIMDLGRPMQGQYYVRLQYDVMNSSQRTAIAQTGIIPAGAESIRFYYFSEFSIAPSVAFNGNQIPLFVLATTTNNQLMWGGDVSSFAGQVGELRFSGFGNLDNILFSPEAVPEPGVFGLLALGFLLIGWRFLRR